MIFKEVIAELGYVGDDGARGALKQAPGLFNHVPTHNLDRVSMFADFVSVAEPAGRMEA